MSQTHPASLGIDVAKATFDAAMLCEGKLAQRTFAMDPDGFAALGRWIREHRIEHVHACLEATGEYGAALALFLYESGHQVSIVNPARIAAYAKSRLARTKTDKSDAALIAHFCAREQPPNWSPPSAEVQELQALVRRVEMPQEMVQQEENRRQSGGSSSAVRASIEATLAFLRARRSSWWSAPPSCAANSSCSARFPEWAGGRPRECSLRLRRCAWHSMLGNWRPMRV